MWRQFGRFRAGGPAAHVPIWVSHLSPLIASSAALLSSLPEAGGATAEDAFTAAIPRCTGRQALKPASCLPAWAGLPKDAAFCWARDICITATILSNVVAI